MNEITYNPDRPLTLADLRQFVERAGEFGIPDDSEIRAQVSWGQKLKKLTVREASSTPPPRRGGGYPSAGRVIDPLPVPPGGVGPGAHVISTSGLPEGFEPPSASLAVTPAFSPDGCPEGHSWTEIVTEGGRVTRATCPAHWEWNGREMIRISRGVPRL